MFCAFLGTSRSSELHADDQHVFTDLESQIRKRWSNFVTSGRPNRYDMIYGNCNPYRPSSLLLIPNAHVGADAFR